MPSRNILKIDLGESFYHLYSRGVNKQSIFVDAKDYAVFLNLCKRYLDKKPSYDTSGRAYPHLFGKLELNAFCLMPNHFHLLVYQKEVGAMQQFMRGLATSYSRYFNTSRRRRGPLFESRYKASRITADDYLQHISRYIHLNPADWQRYEFSSLPYYLGQRSAAWIRPRRILELFDGTSDYAGFMRDYEEHKQILDAIKHELANSDNADIQ